jgi:hypothetical protein
MTSRIDFSAFEDHVKDRIASNTSQWELSASGASEDGKPSMNGLVANKDGVGAQFEYGRKDYFLSGAVKVGSDGTVAPSITYEKDSQLLSVNYSDVSLRYQYTIPSLSGSISSKLIDGLASEASFSCVVSPGYYAGFSLVYDPFRSGLKQMSYGVLATNPSWLKAAVVSAVMTGPSAGNFGLSHQCSSNFVGFAFVENCQDIIIGVDYTSNCGASLSTSVNVFKQNLSVRIKRAIGAWTVNIGAEQKITTIGSKKPTVGISFSAL